MTGYTRIKPNYKGKLRKFDLGGNTQYDANGNQIYRDASGNVISQAQALGQMGGGQVGTQITGSTTTPKTSNSTPTTKAGAISEGANFVADASNVFAKPDSANVGLSTGQGLLKGAGEGAKVGSVFGPEGMVIGAVAGGVIGGVTSLIGSSAKQRKINEAKAYAIKDQNRIQTARSNAELVQYPNQGVQTNYYANGGKLPVDSATYKNPLAYNPNLPLSPKNPLLVEKRDGTIGQWGNPLPGNKDISVVNGKLVILPSDRQAGYSSVYYPSNSQPNSKTPDVIHAKGGKIRKSTVGKPIMPAYGAGYPNQFDTPSPEMAEGSQLQNPQYEAELGETIQGNPQLEDSTQLASDMHQVDGSTHENGGTMGAGGDRVFSDRLKISPQLAEILKMNKISISPDATYAEASNKLGRMKGKFEGKLNSNFRPAINTATKMIDRIDKATDMVFQDQEQQKAYEAKKPNYLNLPKQAMGGKLPKYDRGEDLIAANPKPNYGNTDLQLTTIPQTQDALPQITPDVEPTFGQKLLKYASDNSGEITNFASYLANIGSINKLDTSVNRTYLAPPVYNYADRSGQAKQENQGTFNTAVRSFTGSSRGVSGSNIGALYGATIENNSKINNQENLRRDAYNENYGNRADRINELNTSISNQANDMRRDIYNQKNVQLPLAARNAFLQGVMANKQIKANESAEKAKLFLGMMANNQNGVMTRLGTKMSNANMIDKFNEFYNNLHKNQN